MAKLLAIEWDEREARVAVATPHGDEVVVEGAFAIDISQAVAADATDDSREVGQCIAQALAQRGLTGADVLVGLGRASIELRSLSLPPAPPEELPDMVRFQAMQAFTTIGEDWPLDFVELGTQDDTLNVLAAVVAPKQVEQILQVCAASELKPRCLVLRPFAAASLLNRGQLLAAARNALIVDMLADGADLTAISRGQVVFMRTVRLPDTEDRSVQARALVGEARRTIGAAQAQMKGQRIEQTVICGSATEHPVLAQLLTEALSLDVTLFDPFQAVQLQALEQHLPPDSGRYAPLLGMLADDAAGVRHAIDFLNPRKRPAPRSNRQRNVLIAAGALATVCLVALGIWGGLKYLDGQISGLNEQVAELDKQAVVARETMANADALADFINRDVTWLDEIRELARRMPDADHVKLNDVAFATGNVKRGGLITLKGYVTRAEVIAKFEDSLRDAGHVVSGKSATPANKSPDYPWALDTTVIVVADKYDRGRSQGRPLREQLRDQPAASPEETPAAVKPDRPPAAKPDTPPVAQPESPPEAKPESVPVAGPESKPEAKPESTLEAKPDSTLEAKPEGTLEAKPDSAPATKPETAAGPQAGPVPEPKPEAPPEPDQTEAPTSDAKKSDAQPAAATGGDKS